MRSDTFLEVQFQREVDDGAVQFTVLELVFGTLEMNYESHWKQAAAQKGNLEVIRYSRSHNSFGSDQSMGAERCLATPPCDATLS